MNDVVAEVEESRRGAMVRFEGGERLWFGRGAILLSPFQKISQTSTLNIISLKKYVSIVSKPVFRKCILEL